MKRIYYDIDRLTFNIMVSCYFKTRRSKKMTFKTYLEHAERIYINGIQDYTTVD